MSFGKTLPKGRQRRLTSRGRLDIQVLVGPVGPGTRDVHKVGAGIYGDKKKVARCSVNNVRVPQLFAAYALKDFIISRSKATTFPTCHFSI